MTDGHQLDPESLGNHVDRLYRAAWSLCGSRDEAEDLVQETFARVLQKPRFLRNDDDIGYLPRRSATPR
jgi:RNA polymerase sigma-70 factor (ECF subfamily)